VQSALVVRPEAPFINPFWRTGMNFKEACAQVGYDQQGFNPPTKIYKYFAYKNGQGYECINQEEAEKISPINERVLVNVDEIKNHLLEQAALENKAFKVWEENLRQKHSDVSDYVYNLCYQKAYESNHAYGHDSVAEKLEDEIEFALKLLNHNS
jgi:hypothetical protein